MVFIVSIDARNNDPNDHMAVLMLAMLSIIMILLIIRKNFDDDTDKADSDNSNRVANDWWC